MLLTILLCAALIVVDQLLKHWAVVALAPAGAMPFIPGIMELRYIENDGSAFNLFSGMRVFLIVLTGAALLVGAYILLFRRPKDKLMYLSILMVFSGGMGNWIDRVRSGYVVDYFATLFIDFAVFNFADILICVGFGLLIIAFIRDEMRLKRQKAEEPPPGDTEADGGATAGSDDAAD